jgi:hypothetical protein
MAGPVTSPSLFQLISPAWGERTIVLSQTIGMFYRPSNLVQAFQNATRAVDPAPPPFKASPLIG